MGNRAHVAAGINNSECPFKLCGENPSMKLDCLFLAIDAVFSLVIMIGLYPLVKSD